MRVNVALAALAGLALRFFFVLKLPVTDSGDAPFYIELAWNWLKNGVYGAVVDGQLMPLDTRVPGYPAFLAAIFRVAGNSSPRGDVRAGFRRPGHLLRRGADRGSPGPGSLPTPRAARRTLARGTLPVHGQLHGRRTHRNTGDFPDGPRHSAAHRRPGPRRHGVAESAAPNPASARGSSAASSSDSAPWCGPRLRCCLAPSASSCWPNGGGLSTGRSWFARACCWRWAWCCRCCRGPRATGARCMKYSSSRRATCRCPTISRRAGSTPGPPPGSGNSATSTEPCGS